MGGPGVDRLTLWTRRRLVLFPAVIFSGGQYNIRVQKYYNGIFFFHYLLYIIIIISIRMVRFCGREEKIRRPVCVRYIYTYVYTGIYIYYYYYTCIVYNMCQCVFLAYIRQIDALITISGRFRPLVASSHYTMMRTRRIISLYLCTRIILLCYTLFCTGIRRPRTNGVE